MVSSSPFLYDAFWTSVKLCHMWKSFTAFYLFVMCGATYCTVCFFDMGSMSQEEIGWFLLECVAVVLYVGKLLYCCDGDALSLQYFTVHWRYCTVYTVSSSTENYCKCNYVLQFVVKVCQKRTRRVMYSFPDSIVWTGVQWWDWERTSYIAISGGVLCSSLGLKPLSRCRNAVQKFRTQGYHLQYCTV